MLAVTTTPFWCTWLPSFNFTIHKQKVVIQYLFHRLTKAGLLPFPSKKGNQSNTASEQNDATNLNCSQ